MPDPTVVEFKTVHNREASKHQDHHSDPAPEPPTPGGDHSNDEGHAENSNQKDEGGKMNAEPEVDAESEVVKAPSSWWAISFSSLMASITSAPSTQQPSVTTITTTVTTVTMTEDDTEDATTKSGGSEEETVLVRPASSTDPITPPSDTKSEKGVGTEKRKGTITMTTTSSTTTSEINAADQTILNSTLNSIKKQIAALGKAPPTNVISAYTYWWGYEIYVPHKCMSKLQRVTNTSQIFFGFLSGAVAGMPGLAALVPLSRIISAWVGFQWAVIQAQDLGKGVVLSATWVLPVALAPRSWDHPGTEEDPAPVACPNPKQKKIKSA
ncbi:hypothetical protein BC939DRAFT_442680 [Gamsiella multidivaricata]|uniref:uncharacterized protein n=1 Tax=Gamsiella multidivaricata TaxID=101098 RepID=UPI00222103F1|nr:uncharacterized protein BC939DRAFT_442680 [Gamsiella multidivaricata]KAI7828708.1 hypothetical protein BC939DRAFT_442680 [Gamsiella multidivaricata]